MIDKEELFASLESSGEKTVREKLAQKVYGPQKIDLVHEWLRQKEELRINEATSRADSAASRAESATLEQLRLTRRANIAAYIAAAAAITTIAIEIIKSS